MAIGDDCAVFQPAPGQQSLISTDMLVEGVHFRKDTISARDLGWKALAVSISDIAAMGGTPRAAFLALGLPAWADSTLVHELKTGLMDCARAYGARLVGGDTVSTPGSLLLCTTLLGEVPGGMALLRSGARPGDLVYLGGVVGDSAAGLFLLSAQDPVPGTENFAPLLRAHQRPQPQVELGRLLASAGLASAAIDLSDGLLSDLGQICQESGVGARIDLEALPLSRQAMDLAGRVGRDPLDWAVSGGEDYVLLFTVPPASEKRMLSLCRREMGLRPSRVGEIRSEPGLSARRGAAWRRVVPAGFDHFRP